MMQTVEAVINEHGAVSLLEQVRLPRVQRALVTILDDSPLAALKESALLSEQALGADWNRPEEDAAWSHLKSAV